DTVIRRDTLRLDLKLRDGALNGAIISMFQETPEGGVPERRMRSALAHWAELRRTPSASSAE
ncbi:MAG: hypothetical protein LC772_02010, partial [Chloroflexi bacterium]|nr:hypothetical protein [Chloroflexota bacterium]